MDHERAAENLGALRDGELGEPEKSATLAHLESCPACREQAARQDRLALALFPAPRAPSRASTEAFVRAVLRRLEPEESPLMAWLGARWLAPALGAGAAAMFLFIARPSPEAVAPADVLLLAGDDLVGELVLPSGDLVAAVLEDR